MTRRVLAFAIALLALVGGFAGVLATASGAGASEPGVSTSASPSSSTPDPQPIERLLVLSMPGVSYRDLNLSKLPNLRGLLEQSALADLSARGVKRRPTLGDGYVTIGSGARSLGRVLDDGQCLDTSERFEEGTARAAMARRAGLAPALIPRSSVVCLAQPAIAVRNAGQLYDAKIGLLATELRRAGVHRAVIGNADHDRVLTLPLNRQVGLSLADPNGVVQAGTVGPQLIERDPSAPFGVRADNAAYARAFDENWQGRSVVVVEASDLVRYDQYRTLMSGRARAVAQARALEHFDDLVGRLLARVDPARDAVMIVGPTPLGGTARLTMATLRSPTMRPGLLVSAYTRHSGIVSIVDVSPTILQLFNIDRPSEFEGRPYEYGRSGGDFEARVDWLVHVDEAARFRDAMIGPVVTFYVIAIIVLTVASVVALTWFRWGRRVVEIGALMVLGYLPAVYLANLFPFQDWGRLLYWVFVIGIGSLIGLLVYLFTSRTGVMTLIMILAVVVGVIAIDVLTGAHLQFNSALGYSPTVAGRYAGIGNLAYAQLAAGMLLLAGLVAWRIGGKRGAWFAVALLGLAFVVDGAPIFGADVGGVLSIVPAYAITATMLLGWRVRWRLVALYSAAAVVLLGLFAAFDASRPEDKQTHLGRLVHTTSSGGWGAFTTVVHRKIDANLAVLFRSQWTVMFPLVLACVLYLLIARAPGLRPVVARVSELRATLIGLAVLAVLGFALNDSGIAVPGLMLGVVAPVLIVIAVRGEDAFPVKTETITVTDDPVPELVTT